MKNNDAIDAYAPHLEKLRAANNTPASPFEQDWKNKRTRELAAEDDEVAELRAAHEARITAAELADIPDPPDPYAAGLDTLRSTR